MGGKIIQICSLGERSLISFCPQIFYFFELKTNIKLPLITFKFVQIRIMQYQTLYFTIHRAFTRLLTTCFFFTAVVCRKYCDVCCGGSPVQAVRQHLVPDPTSRQLHHALILPTPWSNYYCLYSVRIQLYH